MEEERIKTLMDSINQYIGFLDFTAPKLQTTCQELLEVVGRISIQAEIESACSRIGTGENRPEQILYYGFEHLDETNLKMESRRYINGFLIVISYSSIGTSIRDGLKSLGTLVM